MKQIKLSDHQLARVIKLNKIECNNFNGTVHYYHDVNYKKELVICYDNNKLSRTIHTNIDIKTADAINIYAINVYKHNSLIECKHYQIRDDAILAMIAKAEILKNQNFTVDVQKDHHDLDGYLVAVRIFISGVQEYLIQLSKVEIL